MDVCRSFFHYGYIFRNNLCTNSVRYGTTKYFHPLDYKKRSFDVIRQEDWHQLSSASVRMDIRTIFLYIKAIVSRVCVCMTRCMSDPLGTRRKNKQKIMK